jgi:putative ABC exporter
LILGHPALRLLARRKIAGLWRRQKRRFKRPSGIIFALIGTLMLGAWLASLILPYFFAGRHPSGPGSVFAGDPVFVQAVALLITLLTLASSLSFRGLYLPKEEIELLFCAPLSRPDIVRYRMLATIGRSLFGAVFFSLVAARLAPQPLYGFFGGILWMLTLPIVGQAASLLTGDAENKLAARLAKFPWRLISVVGVLLLLGLFLLALKSGRPGRSIPILGSEDSIAELLHSPLVRFASAPFKPWAELILAKGALDFLTWLGICAAIWVALFEATARIPIDFRELSLQTSADVAKRISRFRRGAGGVSASEAAKGSAAWRVPWLFGRGPFGALAWRKSASILRKARGTIITSALIVVVLTLVSTVGIGGGRRDSPTQWLFIPVFGTLYLCAGLRFDFREDLERMDVIKSWPMPPWRIFLAAILPEAVLIAVLLSIAVLIRALISGSFHPALVAILVALPPCVLAWIAIDNAVFLYMPVRFVAGQEGVLHHAGRSFVLMLVRALVAAVVASAVVLIGFVVFRIQDSLHWSETFSNGLAVLLGLLVLIAEDCALIFFGGKLLSRFDVARDKG